MKSEKRHGIEYYMQILTAASGFILFLLIISRVWWEEEHGKPGLADIFFPHVEVINNMLAVTGMITVVLVFTCAMMRYKNLKKEQKNQTKSV